MNLEITGDDVEKLGDEGLRTLIVKLCTAELSQAKLPLSSLLAGGNQTAGDGGVDVRVELTSTSTNGLDFIPRTSTVFQSKAEDMPAGAIAEEMRPKGVLRPSIQELIEKGGAYVIVSSKGSHTDSSLRKRKEAMKAAVENEPSAEKLQLDFYDRVRLATWVNKFPGVELWLRDSLGAPLQGWQGYGAWARGELGTPYICDGASRFRRRSAGLGAVPVNEGAKKLKAVLETPGGVARLIGLSGSGKTRLVQALFEDSFDAGPPLDSALVHYTDLGQSPVPSAKEMLAYLGSNGKRAIVVVDNCNPKTHRELGNVVQDHKNFLSLLTVEYDVAEDDTPEATDVFELGLASEHVVEDVLRRYSPGLSDGDAKLVSSFSGGNARIALALARTVKGGESLGALQDADLFERLFRQGQPHDPDLLRAGEVLALVYSFDGMSVDAGSELEAFGKLIGKSAYEMYSYVAVLCQRELLQQRSQWRATMPPAVAHRLANAALQKLHLNQISSVMAPLPRLQNSFARRLGFLSNSKGAIAIARSWLNDPQVLGDLLALDEHKKRLLTWIAPLDTDAVLSKLEVALEPNVRAAFAAKNGGELHFFGTLARHLAHGTQYFERAADVLVELAFLTDPIDNDCSTAFRELFQIGLSGTLAPAKQRALYLRSSRALASGSRHALRDEARSAMLAIGDFGSSHDFSFGSRKDAYGWEPKSDDDMASWLTEAFAEARTMAAGGPDGLATARNVVVANLRELWQQEQCLDDLAALIRELNVGGWPTAWIATRTALRFEGGHISPQSREKLRNLSDSLKPMGLEEQIVTYVGNHPKGMFDIANVMDESDEQERLNGADAWVRVSELVVALGVEASMALSTLKAVLPELQYTDGGRVKEFGIGLGKGTLTPEGHWALLKDSFAQARETRTSHLLEGFIEGLRQRDRTLADRLLSNAMDDPALAGVYFRLLGQPLDDLDGDRIILALSKLNPRQYPVGFRLTIGGSPGLSIEKFCQVASAMAAHRLSMSAAVDATAAALLQIRRETKEAPGELVALGRALLQLFPFDKSNPMAASRVASLAKLCLVGEDAQETASVIATSLIKAIDEKGVQASLFADLVRAILELQTAIGLDYFLQSPSRRVQRLLSSPLNGRKGSVVGAAPIDPVLAWVRDDAERRAPLIAREIDILERKPREEKSSSLTVDEDLAPRLSELAQKLLELTPDKAQLLQAFGSSLRQAVTTEQDSTRYLALLTELERHQDPLVKPWAVEIATELRKRVADSQRFQSSQEQQFE